MKTLKHYFKEQAAAGVGSAGSIAGVNMPVGKPKKKKRRKSKK